MHALLWRYAVDVDMSKFSDAEHLTTSENLRARIVKATADLIDQGGRDAATTRAVAAAAGVQAPAIYRIFGDMRGLLEAVAEHRLSVYVEEKSRREPHPDPVQDLRDGWDMQVAFGLTHPGLFAIMSSDPQARAASPAFAAGLAVMRRRINAIARAGRLRVSEERAADLLQAMSIGTVLTLLAQPENQRDVGFSAAARESVLTTITNDEIKDVDTLPRAAATTLRASLGRLAVLSHGEKALVSELMERIANNVSKS